jgi:CRISPR-associated endonuclease/helicase Cas3
MARLQERLQPNQSVERHVLQDAIAEALDAPKEFQQYRHRWGAIQAQGMLWRMGEDNATVMQPVRDRMVADLQNVYGSRLKPWLGGWSALGKDSVGRAIQQELLRFRGGSTLQAAVWDGDRFYTYDLLRLLPYALVAPIDRATFLAAAAQAGLDDAAFPAAHIHLYVQVQDWVSDRFDISLHCNWNTSDLTYCDLTLLSRLSLVGHPQPDVTQCLYSQTYLTFLVPLGARQQHWDVSRHLNLSPTFGLYSLTDGSNKQRYACAFNQDALLLDALKNRLIKFCHSHPQSLIF